MFVDVFRSIILVEFDDGFIFFFKQKTAYEMRISDWSSDVCSSDLRAYDQNMARGSPCCPHKAARRERATKDTRQPVSGGFVRPRHNCSAPVRRKDCAISCDGKD